MGIQMLLWKMQLPAEAPEWTTFPQAALLAAARSGSEGPGLHRGAVQARGALSPAALLGAAKAFHVLELVASAPKKGEELKEHLKKISAQGFYSRTPPQALPGYLVKSVKKYLQASLSSACTERWKA